MSKTPDTYRQEDIGLFLGFATLPQSEFYKFYKSEFDDGQNTNGLFPTYRNGLKKNLIKENENDPKEIDALKHFDKYLYKPRAFCLLGSFDLAILSLVDDFTFGVRAFHARNLSNKPKHDHACNFKYQIQSCLTPTFFEPKKEHSLIHFWEEKVEFLDNDKARPLIGICSLKINNTIVIGGGLNALKLVTWTMDKLGKEVQKKCEEKKPGTKLNFLVMEALSWNEITLLVFGNSFEQIGELINRVKEAKIEDLLNHTGPNERINFSEDLRVFKENSLLTAVLQKKGEEIATHGTHSHLFVREVTYFGIDLELLSEDTDRVTAKIAALDKDDKVRIYKKWNVKPGHLATAVNLLRKIEATHGGGEIDELYIGFGNGNFVLPGAGTKPISTSEAVRRIKGYHNTPYSTQLDKHILQSTTFPEVLIDYDLQEHELDDKKHVYVSDFLRELRKNFKSDATGFPEDIQTKLIKLGIAKVITEKIINIYSTYNDYMQDSVLYGYFIDLLPFLENLESTINYYHKRYTEEKTKLLYSENEKLSNTLDSIAEAFEKAHYNRVMQSTLMSELTDFNLEMKGGIQQLVTAIDGAYKGITSLAGTPGSFVYVSSFPGIDSKQYHVRLNYYHLFQPSIFLSIAVHEAANSFLSRPVNAKLKDSINEAIKSVKKEGTSLEDELKEVYKRTIQRLAKGVSNVPLDKENIDTILSAEKNLTAEERNRLIKLKLYNIIGFEFYNYIVVDLFSFYLTFNQNIDLFLYWHWNYFLQMSSIYKSPGKIKDTDFIVMYLRTVALINCTVGDKHLPEMNKLVSKISFLKEHFFNYSEQIIDFLDHIESEKHRTVLGELDAAITSACVVDYARNNKFKSYRNNKKGQRNTLEYIRQYVDKKSTDDRRSFLKLIRKGIPVEYNPQIHTAVSYFQCLSFAYLTLVRNYQSLGDTSIVPRDFEGDGGVESQKLRDRGNYLFDQRGGMFVHNAGRRREYYKYRAAIFRSLWDLSMKSKMIYFTPSENRGYLPGSADFFDSQADINKAETDSAAAPSARRYKIFISYATENQDFATEVVDSLKSEYGDDVFIYYEPEANDQTNLKAKLENQIHDSDMFILFYSKELNEFFEEKRTVGRFLRDELTYATAAQESKFGIDFIFVVMMDGIQRLPVFFNRDVRRHSYNNKNDYNRLLTAIRNEIANLKRNMESAQ